MRLTLLSKLIIFAVIGVTLSSYANDEVTEKAQAGKRQLEVITVTAQKRTESVKEVPLSVATVNRETLENMNITNTEEL